MSFNIGDVVEFNSLRLSLRQYNPIQATVVKVWGSNSQRLKVSVPDGSVRAEIQALSFDPDYYGVSSSTATKLNSASTPQSIVIGGIRWSVGDRVETGPKDEGSYPTLTGKGTVCAILREYGNIGFQVHWDTGDKCGFYTTGDLAKSDLIHLGVLGEIKERHSPTLTCPGCNATLSYPECADTAYDKLHSHKLICFLCNMRDISMKAASKDNTPPQQNTTGLGGKLHRTNGSTVLCGAFKPLPDNTGKKAWTVQALGEPGTFPLLSQLFSGCTCRVAEYRQEEEE